MAVNNPFKITYGSRALGGASGTYQLLGPYVIEKSFETLRLVFDVVVVGTTYATLQNACDDLETDLRKRDQDLVIDLNNIADAGGSSTWTYTSGSNILNVTASLQKTGDPETDRGFSRAYTCTIEGDLPGDDNAGSPTGLRDVSFSLDYEAGRQRTVTMEGVYTATSTRAAVANYEHSGGADAEFTTFKGGLSGSPTFELVEESYQEDRNDHLCQFSRQYVELLVNQSQGSLDDANIRDHVLAFTDMSQHAGGDGEDFIYRLRRVSASFDCAADIDQTTDLQSLFDDTIYPHVKQLFETEFNPQVLALEDKRVGYDESRKRVSAQVTFLYQPQSGDFIVEMTRSTAYREQRVIDYTHTHSGGEFDAYVDPGWAILERVHSRTVRVMGQELPQRRLGQRPKFESGLGEIEGIEAGQDVRDSGWNIISSTSQAGSEWFGDPDEEQIETAVLSEMVVERFNQKPDGRGTRPVPRRSGPTTGQRGGNYGWRSPQ